MEQNLNVFISELFEKLSDEYSNLNEKRLITDIINIYMGVFDSYNHYKTYITKNNERINLINNSFIHDNFKTRITLEPKHTVISLNLYNYIRELSNYYEENK